MKLSRNALLVWACLMLTNACMLAAEPTAPELLQLMGASSDRLQSLTVNMTISSYFAKEGDKDPMPLERQKVDLKWTPGRMWAKTAVFRPNGADTFDVPLDFEQTISISPRQTKTLIKTPGAARPKGTIMQNDQDAPGWQIDQVVRNPLGARIMERIAADKKAVLTQEEGVYHVKAVVSESNDWIVDFTVDPGKGFLCTQMTVSNKDGQPIQQYKASDIRQVGQGIWFPFKIVRTMPRDKLVWDLAQAVANTAIPEKELDFVFPSGTSVNDRVANLRYVVDKVEGAPMAIDDPNFGSASSPTTGPLTKQDLSPKSPASDNDLAQAAKIAADRGAPLNSGGWPVWSLILCGSGVLVLAVIAWALLHVKRSRIRSTKEGGGK
jgi:hypothetical protein